LDNDDIGSPKVVNDFNVGVGHQEVFEEIGCEIITGVDTNGDVFLFHRPLHLAGLDCLASQQGSCLHFSTSSEQFPPMAKVGDMNPNCT